MFNHRPDTELAEYFQKLANYLVGTYGTSGGYLRIKHWQDKGVTLTVSKKGLFGMTYQNPGRGTDAIEVFRGQLYVSSANKDYDKADWTFRAFIREMLPEIASQIKEDVIPTVILKQWLKENKVATPYDVNSGMCTDFASYLHELFPESFLRYTEDYIPDTSPDHPGGHCWLYLDGKHYDSESLGGVDDWTDLPIIKRNMANMEKRKNATNHD